MGRGSSALQVVAIAAALSACNSCQSGEAEPVAAQAPAAHHGWHRLADVQRLRVGRPAAPRMIEVGGRRLHAQLGLPAGGTPVLSADGAWAVWVGGLPAGVVVRELATGRTRVLRVPAGAEPAQAVFFGEGANFALAVLMSTSRGDAPNVDLLVRYDIATLQPTHALSNDGDLSNGCSHLFGTERSFGCIVTFDPSYVLTVSADMRAIRTHRIPSRAVGRGVSAVVPDGAWLWLVDERPATQPSSILSVDLVTGDSTSFAAPVTGQVAALAADSRGTHLALSTSEQVVLLALRSRRVIRRLPSNGRWIDELILSDDLTIWHDWGSGFVAHPPRGSAQRRGSLCSQYSAMALTRDSIVLATHDGLCVHDRATGAVDPARSTIVGGLLAWRGDALFTVTQGWTDDAVPVPYTTRWSLTEGRATRVDRTYAGYVAALQLDARLPDAYTGTLAEGTPMLLAIAGDRAVAQGVGLPHLRDLSTGRALATVTQGAAFRAGGRELVVSTRDEGLVILSSRDGSVLRTLRPRGTLADVIISPTGDHAVLLDDTRAELVSLADGASIRTFPEASAAAFRSDGREVAVAAPFSEEGGTARVARVSVPDGQDVEVIEVERAVHGLVYAPSGDALATVDQAGIELHVIASGP